MARVNSQQWLDKWGRRLGAAGSDIQAGVDRTTQAPGAAAAASAQLWQQKMQDPSTQKKWATQVAAVPLQSWKDSMKNKGIPRLSQGITQAQQTKGARIQALLTAVDAAAADANALPKGSLDQNIARSVAFQRSMAARAPRLQS